MFPLPNSAPDSLTPANQKFDLFLFVLALRSFGAGSAFAAGAASAPEKLVKMRTRLPRRIVMVYYRLDWSTEVIRATDL